MKRSWSAQIESRYGVKLTSDLRRWLDDELWKVPGAAEFCQPLSPDEILHPTRGLIWAGFMLPDTLPLIGNGYGDWLCMRIGTDGSVTEIIRWNHAGGDWMPLGSSLAEALLYDAAMRVMYDRRPEFVEPEPPREEVFRWAEWARGVDLPQTQVKRFWETDVTFESTHLDQLLETGAAVAAARHERLLKYLDSQLKALCDPVLAGELETSWEPDFVSWIFDNRLLPTPVQSLLSQRFDIPADELTGQQWAEAEQEALAVCRLRSDLGWAYDVAGWAAERRGDQAEAVQHYLVGVKTSLFADDTVSFRTHWFPEGYGKFAAARLAGLSDHLSQEVNGNGYLRVLWENDAASLHVRLRDYWLSCAEQAESKGNAALAYQCYHNAGWDLGLREINGFDHIFDGLTRSATAAGSHALSLVAAVHRSCLHG